MRTLFFGHARATSFSSARTESKTQQNIELMKFALTWYANMFVGCSATPTFFRQITSFLIPSIILKNKKKICTWEVSYTIQIGSNWCMDTGVRNLEVIFLRLILADLMTHLATIYTKGLYMLC